MTRVVAITSFTDRAGQPPPGGPELGARVHKRALGQRATPQFPIGSNDSAPAAHGSNQPARSGPLSFYVDTPTIPEGMTCAEWRDAYRRMPKLGPIAHLRAWLRWHQFREVIR